MSDSSAPYRIWIAGANEWLPGPSYSSLDLAVASAQRLAASGEVAIELPSRHWHTFSDTGEKFLGPASVLAKGSQTNLAERASAALESSSDPQNRAYTLSIGKVRPVKRPARAQKLSSPHLSTPHTRESAQIAVPQPAVVTPTPVTQPIATQPVTQPMPVAEASQQIHTGPERRDTKRYDASLILGEPTCSINSRRTEIVDISETGLKLALPAGLHLQIANNVVVVFSGRHGFFELRTRACWCTSSHAGVRIEEGASNLVGRMFLRKMIAKWLERERKRARRKR